MPSIETYRKQAKLLVRWHRERNYSIGEKLRLLERYRHLTDVEVLEMAMPLTLAQEIVAVEAGFYLDLGCLRSATFAPNQRDSSAQPTMAIETAQRHDVAGYSVRIVTPAPNTAVCCRVYAGAVGSAPA